MYGLGVQIGECVDWEGNATEGATVTIDSSESEMTVDIAIPLPDDENGDSRTVNATMPMKHLQAALMWLESREKDAGSDA